MQPNNTGMFIQTLTEKSIAIQTMRVQRYDRAVKDDNGWKELVDLRNRNTFAKYLIMVLINVFMSVWYFFVSVSKRKSVCSYYCTLPGPGALLQQ